MTLDELHEYFGSFYKAAKFLNMTHTSTMNWKKKGYIPIQTQMKIEILTDGNLKAKVDDCKLS